MGLVRFLADAIATVTIPATLVIALVVAVAMLNDESVPVKAFLGFAVSGLTSLVCMAIVTSGDP